MVWYGGGTSTNHRSLSASSMVVSIQRRIWYGGGMVCMYTLLLVLPASICTVHAEIVSTINFAHGTCSHFRQPAFFLFRLCECVVMGTSHPVVGYMNMIELLDPVLFSHS